MAHPYHQDSSFSFSQPQPQAPPPPPPAPITSARPRKAKKCRKRHPPPGPAGVWFVSRTNNGASGNSNSNYPHHAHSPSSTPDEEEDLRATSSSVVSNPAWMAMQCSLQLFLPDISRMQLTPIQRYRLLKPHVPQDYLLLPHVQNATYWKLPENEKIIVLVHAVTCHHDNIWYVSGPLICFLNATVLFFYLTCFDETIINFTL
jgi:hypothetical protein